MSDNEILQAILSEVKQTNARLDKLEQRMDKLEQRMDTLEQRMDTLEQRMDAIEQRMDAIEQRMDAIEQRMDTLENEVGSLKVRVDLLEEYQKHTQITLETIVEKCVDVLGEGYQATYEKIDRLPIASMNSKITQIELLTKLNKNDIDVLKKKVG